MLLNNTEIKVLKQLINDQLSALNMIPKKLQNDNIKKEQEALKQLMLKIGAKNE